MFWQHFEQISLGQELKDICWIIFSFIFSKVVLNSHWSLDVVMNIVFSMNCNSKVLWLLILFGKSKHNWRKQKQNSLSCSQKKVPDFLWNVFQTLNRENNSWHFINEENWQMLLSCIFLHCISLCLCSGTSLLEIVIGYLSR